MNVWNNLEPANNCFLVSFFGSGFSATGSRQGRPVEQESHIGEPEAAHVQTSCWNMLELVTSMFDYQPSKYGKCRHTWSNLTFEGQLCAGMLGLPFCQPYWRVSCTEKKESKSTNVFFIKSVQTTSKNMLGWGNSKKTKGNTKVYYTACKNSHRKSLKVQKEVNQNIDHPKIYNILIKPWGFHFTRDLFQPSTVVSNGVAPPLRLYGGCGPNTWVEQIAPGLSIESSSRTCEFGVPKKKRLKSSWDDVNVVKQNNNVYDSDNIHNIYYIQKLCGDEMVT